MNLIDDLKSCLKESEYVINKLSLLTTELSKFVAIKFPENTQIDVLINHNEGRN